MDVAILVLFGLAILVALLFIARAGELFALSVRDGETLVVRGSLRPSLRQSLGEVVRSAGIRRATIRAVRAEGHARLVVTGQVDAGTVQRLRNVFGTHPMHRYRAAPSEVHKRNLGQWLGIAWLAWLLARGGR
jgi:hypothetical protein